MTTVPRARLMLALIASLVLVAVAMPRAAVSAPRAQAGQPLEIVSTERVFSPAEPVATVGTVRPRILNVGIRRHSLVLLVEGIEHASPEARPGDTVEWEVSLERPGRYIFWCGRVPTPGERDDGRAKRRVGAAEEH